MPIIGNALAFSIGNAYTGVMNPIQKAIKALGSQAQMAEALSVKQPTISEWARGERPIPIERCVQIEQATKGVVTRQELRPDDWQRIWPELTTKPRKTSKQPAQAGE